VLDSIAALPRNEGLSRRDEESFAMQQVRKEKNPLPPCVGILSDIVGVMRFALLFIGQHSPKPG
jgi:hypothetical protein